MRLCIISKLLVDYTYKLNDSSDLKDNSFLLLSKINVYFMNFSFIYILIIAYSKKIPPEYRFKKSVFFIFFQSVDNIKQFSITNCILLVNLEIYLVS